jgi:hypothetical protein
MPRRLLARCRPDSIDEFRKAAEARLNDGLQLAASGRRMAAVYLWGYSAEMAIKAAYFSLTGFGRQAPITKADLWQAIALGKGLGMLWPQGAAGHNVRAWAELLVVEANTNPAVMFDVRLGLDIQRHAQRVSEHWNETLRYHKNVPYGYELRQVRTSAEWLLTNTMLL